MARTQPVSVRDHYQALPTLANRLVGILQGCLRTHTLYNEHLTWHNELDKLSLQLDGFPSWDV
jgi:hypothetical protein